MNNKQQINRLKDMAELAWASYFEFDLLKDANNIPRKIYELDSNGNKIKDENSPRGHKEIEVTLEHIASIKYQKQEVLVNLQQDNTWQSNVLNFLNEKTNTDKLKGDFSPTQAKNFFERYDLLKHCPNTDSGFSATLFQNKHTKEYILSIRGTESKKVA